jgi:hypothetical protein
MYTSLQHNTRYINNIDITHINIHINNINIIVDDIIDVCENQGLLIRALVSTVSVARGQIICG